MTTRTLFALLALGSDAEAATAMGVMRACSASTTTRVEATPTSGFVWRFPLRERKRPVTQMLLNKAKNAT